MKVVINACYGGFGLSHKAVMRYAELKGIKLYPYVDESTIRIYQTDDIEQLIKRHACIHYVTVPPEEYKKLSDESKKSNNYKKINETYFSDNHIKREDRILIKVVEELGKEANGDCANLKIVEIPDDVKYTIDEYDGFESIHEQHRSWS